MLVLYCIAYIVQVVKLMSRMGKPIPEHQAAPMPPAPPPQTAPGAGATSGPVMKKVYCTPKINFIGELLLSVMPSVL